MSKFSRQSLALYAVAITGFTLSILAFWPGFMEYDSFKQYAQAIGKLPLDDWHPVSMTLLWKVLISLYNGPEPMLVLQMFLYWAGFLYLAWHLLLHTSRFSLALIAVITAFFPFLINFSGVIWKDTQLAVSLFWAVLLLEFGKLSRGKLLITLILIFYAISVRHNGIAAALPIIVLWSYEFVCWTGINKQYSVPIITVCACLLYLIVNLGLSHFIAFEKVKILNGQLLNEVAFIECQFDDKKLDIIHDYYGEKLLKINPQDRKKYLCNEIDSLAKTTDISTIYDDKILELPDDNDHQIKNLWFQSIISHPFLYLKYRIEIYLTFLRPFNYSEPYYVSTGGIDENPLPFKLPFKVLNPFNLTTILNDYMDFTSEYMHLLFRPLFWLITLSATVIFSVYKRNLVICLVAFSGLLYLLGYFPFLDAPDFRYAYYSIFAQILSIFIFMYQIFD